MAFDIVNVLLTTFRGLGLPPTLALPVDASYPITDLLQQLLDYLPQTNCRLIFTTHCNKEVTSSLAPIRSLLSSDKDTFLPLRLSVPLCGGKGGFGSQLRAAGGRMSSRRKNNQGASVNSNRNLDGRRLRTINEAKALAEYLALKPEMEQKERETRRKRWEQIVELAERKEDEIRSGSKGKVDGNWVEDKEEAGERAREAVLAAMKSGDYHDNLKQCSNPSLIGGSSLTSEESEDDKLCQWRSNRVVAATSQNTPLTIKSYAGFDDDDEYMSDDEDTGSVLSYKSAR